jgi:hypothetical protein
MARPQCGTPLVIIVWRKKTNLFGEKKVYVVNKELINLSWDALPDWDISEVEKERRKTVMR